MALNCVLIKDQFCSISIWFSDLLTFSEHLFTCLAFLQLLDQPLRVEIIKFALSIHTSQALTDETKFAIMKFTFWEDLGVGVGE